MPKKRKEVVAGPSAAQTRLMCVERVATLGTAAAVARATGLDHRYVADLLRLTRKAHPDVLAQFDRGEISIDDALSSITLPQSAQIAHAEKVATDGDPRKLRKRDVRQMIVAVQRSNHKDKVAITLALRCVLGEASIPGVWPPVP